MAEAISVSGMVKSFGKTRALDGLSLSVRTGEVHGFLGPNGAGKSTTLRVLLALIRKDEGAVYLLGGDPWKDAARLHHHLAYVPGDVTLWPNLSGGGVIDLLGRMRGGLDPRRRADLLGAGSGHDPARTIRTTRSGEPRATGTDRARGPDPRPSAGPPPAPVPPVPCATNKEAPT